MPTSLLITALLIPTTLALSAAAQTIDMEPVPINVALGADTSTNGALWLDFWSPEILVDGDRGNVVHGDGPGGVTGEAEAPGFSYTIDLGETVALDGIKLFPRVDCCPDRLRDFRVSVLADNNGGVGAEVWGVDLFPHEDAVSPVDLTAAHGVGEFMGRYVMVTTNQSPVDIFELQISEIEVYKGVGGEQPINYALGADAFTNGTIWSTLFSPVFLTDGVSNFFVHGDGPGGTAGIAEEEGFYYEIDLGQVIEIAEIHIVPRQDGCCPERLSNYLVTVHEDEEGKAGQAVWSGVFRDDLSFPDTLDPDVITGDADPTGTFSGQWIRVTSLETQEDIDAGLGNYRLQMSEIEVYGHLGRGLVGDYDRSGFLDVADIDLLSAAVRADSANTEFDLDANGMVNDDDRTVWVNDLRQTFFGDSNLDGEFNSADLIQIFSTGEYQDETPLNSTWATGDWNGDGEFTSSDLIRAFIDGGYESGPRVPAQNVPEPSGVTPLILAALALSRARRAG